MLVWIGVPVLSVPVMTSVFTYWPFEFGQNCTLATQLCPGISVVQVLDGTLYTPTGWTTTAWIATPPVLVTVTGTIGMGQYGGGVVGKSAMVGFACRMAVVAVVGGCVGGGLVGGGLVGAGLVGAGGKT